MAILTAGFILAQIGLRVVPVLLRSAAKRGGVLALRYMVTDTNAKVKITSELAKKVLKGKYIDDVGKFTTRSKDNPVFKILESKDLKLLSAGERNTLMQEAYRDASRVMQSKTSYSLEAKLAGDIQKGFGQSFSKEASGRLFIAGDRATVAAKEVLKKTATAPKALPKPTVTQMAKVEATEAGKVATEAAKSRVTAGLGINRQVLKEVPKEARKQIVKLQRATKKLKTAATGTETGPVITQ